MYKNIMKKLKFNMKEIKLFDSFAGIGALYNSLKELDIPTKLIGISEIDVDAIISYGAIHINNFKNLPFTYPSNEKIKQYLMNKNIGYDFKKSKSKIPRLNKNKLRLCYKSSILTNNLGDISKINPDELSNFDLFNFSFPCTNISVAGKQEGMKRDDGSITSSGLYIYGINIIKIKKPKYIMIENVKNLISKKFINDFYSIINELNDIGYNCYYPMKEDKKENKVPTCLNAKNYGIPQNRDRIFIICIRKDIDNNGIKFWEGKDFGIRLKDILEDNVDEKYYLSQEIQDRFKLNGTKDNEHNELNIVGSSAPGFRSIGQRDMTYGVNGIMSTLTATDYKQPKQILDTNKMIIEGNTVLSGHTAGRIFDKEGISPTVMYRNSKVIQIDDNKLNQIGDIQGGSEQGNRVYDIKDLAKTQCSNRGSLGGVSGLYLENTNDIKVIGSTLKEGKTDFSVMNRVYDIKGVSPTIDTMQGGNRQPKILSNSFVDKNGREQQFKETKNYIQWDTSGKEYKSQVDRAFYEDGNIGTIPAMNPQDKTQIIENMSSVNFRIRKLTPLECWRLMGFKDEDFYKAKEIGISDSQLYKQAGNSIVVNCLYYIFKELFKNYII